MKPKELFWLLGTAIFVLILNFYLFGIEGFKPESVTSLNLGDTYFVIANIQFILPLSVLIFFSVYLIRMLRRNFKNLTANLIFIISAVLSIWIVTGMISIADSYVEIIDTNEYNLPVTNNMFDNVSTSLHLSQIIIVVLIAYSGFKTGQNYKMNEQKNSMY